MKTIPCSFERVPLSAISTSELAFCTGHKLTAIQRVSGGPLVGLVYVGRLDAGPLQRLTEIRQRLVAEYKAKGV